MPSDNDSTGVAKYSVDMLDGAHRDALALAISRVLSTELAETTYAQILDGLPLESVVDDGPAYLLPPEHMFWGTHLELCPGVLERIKEFRANFSISILKFDAMVR